AWIGIRSASQDLPVHDPAAVDVYRLARDLGRAVGREKYDHVGDVARFLPAAQWHDRPDFLACPVLVGTLEFGRLSVIPGLPDRSIERRFHHSGADGVDAHAAGGQV